jgi:hypothetical protein
MRTHEKVSAYSSQQVVEACDRFTALLAVFPRDTWAKGDFLVESCNGKVRCCAMGLLGARDGVFPEEASELNSVFLLGLGLSVTVVNDNNAGPDNPMPPEIAAASGPKGRVMAGLQLIRSRVIAAGDRWVAT